MVFQLQNDHSQPSTTPRIYIATRLGDPAETRTCELTHADDEGDDDGGDDEDCDCDDCNGLYSF